MVCWRGSLMGERGASVSLGNHREGQRGGLRVGDHQRHRRERSVNNKWGLPEFQRGFVWKATQVRDLIGSLWLSYPVGTLLVWDNSGPVQPRNASDSQDPDLWVVDGQQRTTALCILSGRKPHRWSSTGEWEKTIRKYDIRFDIHTKEPPFFVVANAATRRAKGSRYLPTNKLLTLDVNREGDQKTLQEMAKQVKLDGTLRWHGRDGGLYAPRSHPKDPGYGGRNNYGG
jgi:hypothetical protein